MRRVIKITAAALIVALIISAAAYGAYQLHRHQQEPRTVYEDAYITVTHAGRATIVLDSISGREYTYTTTRRKRATDPAEAAQRAKIKTGTNTDTIRIETAYDVLIVTEKTTGDTLVFKSH